MKKKVIFILLALAVSLAACSNKQTLEKEAVKVSQDEEDTTETIEEVEPTEEELEEITSPWLKSEYEEYIYREDGSILGGFNIPIEVSNFETQEIDKDYYSVLFESNSVDPYNGRPYTIWIGYSYNENNNNSIKNEWKDMKKGAEDEYIDIAKDEKTERYFVNSEENIKTDLTDFDLYSYTKKPIDKLDISNAEGNYIEVAYAELDGEIIKLTKLVEEYGNAFFERTSLREFIPIILNDKSYKEKIVEENELNDDKEEASNNDNSYDDNKDGVKEEIESKDTPEVKAEEPKQEKQKLTNDGVTHTYIYNETGYAVNGIPLPTTVKITTTGSTPTQGSTVSVSGLNDTVGFAEVDAAGNRGNAAIKETKSTTYTIKNSGTTGLLIWIEPWDDAWGGGFEDVLKWNSDGTLTSQYNPGNFAQLN